MMYILPPAPEVGASRAAVDRILATHARSDHAGKDWYVEMRVAIGAIASAAGFTFPYLSAVTVASALSPGVQWETVLEYLPNALRAFGEFSVFPGPFYSRSIERARRAYEEGPDSLQSGPKTHRFALNLLGHAEYATVDRWAARVAALRIGTPAQYAIAEASYQEAARILGVSTAEVQADTWVAVRSGQVALP
jgi:hypothetical protein